MVSESINSNNNGNRNSSPGTSRGVRAIINRVRNNYTTQKRPTKTTTTSNSSDRNSNSDNTNRSGCTSIGSSSKGSGCNKKKFFEFPDFLEGERHNVLKELSENPALFTEFIDNLQHNTNFQRVNIYLPLLERSFTQEQKLTIIETIGNLKNLTNLYFCGSASHRMRRDLLIHHIIQQQQQQQQVAGVALPGPPFHFNNNNNELGIIPTLTRALDRSNNVHENNATASDHNDDDNTHRTSSSTGTAISCNSRLVSLRLLDVKLDDGNVDDGNNNDDENRNNNENNINRNNNNLSRFAEVFQNLRALKRFEWKNIVVSLTATNARNNNNNNNNSSSNHSLDILAQALAKLPSIEGIILSRCSTPTTSTAISATTTRNQNHSLLSKESISLLCKSKTLKSLVLRRLGLGEEQIQPIIHTLRRTQQHNHQQSQQNQKPGQTNQSTLAGGPYFCVLENLDLYGNRLRNASLINICNVLQHNTALKQLNLQNNPFDNNHFNHNVVLSLFDTSHSSSSRSSIASDSSSLNNRNDSNFCYRMKTTSKNQQQPSLNYSIHDFKVWCYKEIPTQVHQKLQYYCKLNKVGIRHVPKTLISSENQRQQQQNIENSNTSSSDSKNSRQHHHQQQLLINTMIRNLCKSSYSKNDLDCFYYLKRNCPTLLFANDDTSSSTDYDDVDVDHDDQEISYSLLDASGNTNHECTKEDSNPSDTKKRPNTEVSSSDKNLKIGGNSVDKGMQAKKRNKQM